MKKIWLFLLALMVLVGFSFASAQAAAPKGLENKPLLEKRVFIHYKKGHAKPDWVADRVKKPKEVQCYGFLSRGAKIKSPKDLMIGTGIDLSAISKSASEWDDHTDAIDLFSDIKDYPGATWDGWSDSKPDGENEFVYDNYPKDGVIAVAVVWGYFSGPPSYRQITEFDVLFDTDYEWGNADNGNSNVMDLQNIATHEIGHGVGLGDMYDSACSEVTMYGYSGYGEIKKRTLDPADIEGLRELYGK